MKKYNKSELQYKNVTKKTEQNPKGLLREKWITAELKIYTMFMQKKHRIVREENNEVD